MKDFTIQLYKKLIIILQIQRFPILTFNEYLSKSLDRFILLRHDVDLCQDNSLKFARIEAEMGIRGTYYFRMIPESINEKIIKEIYSLGHEIGYHYEDLSFAQSEISVQGIGLRAKGEELEKLLVSIGIESFKKNLNRLREIVPVNTICMHGSPMSKWDSRLLWKYYDYNDLGIAGEPYFDTNFNEILYLTDTGRRWDGSTVSVRDKVTEFKELETKGLRDKETLLSPLVPQSLSPLFYHLKFHSTFDIIRAAIEGKLPDKIMMTFHPQRWTDKPIPWMKELVWQNCKNAVKYLIVKFGKR